MSDASLEKDATKLLVFYRQSEYVHESTGRMVETLQELGELNHWCVETSEDSAVFSDLETLMAFDVVVFAHTSGDLLLDEPQQRNLQQFLSNHKKGFMGIHSAAATMMGLSWWRDLIGAIFIGHPDPQQGTVSFNAEAAIYLKIQFPSSPWCLVDEWYNFDRNVKDVPGFTIVATVDESTYDADKCEKEDWKGIRMGSIHPVVWHHEYGRSRSFYCALGHPPNLCDDPTLRSILQAGINWAAYRA